MLMVVVVVVAEVVVVVRSWFGGCEKILADV